jgi:uncharacterized membrane protein required for colicin V production
VNSVDLAALLLLLAFAYKGYRTGLVRVVLGLTGGLLAFGLAAACAPAAATAVSPLVTERLGVPAWLLRPVLLVALTIVLRFLLGFAVRELVAVISLLIRGVPPLALADRLLGVAPAAALGSALALALVAVAQMLPLGAGIDRQIDDSWLVRVAISHPEDTLRGAWRLGERALTDPPRLNVYLLAVGLGGLAMAAFAAGRLRGPAFAAARTEAPTRRMANRAPPQTETGGSIAWARMSAGVLFALAMMVGLLVVTGAR